MDAREKDAKIANDIQPGRGEQLMLPNCLAAC